MYASVTWEVRRLPDGSVEAKPAEGAVEALFPAGSVAVLPRHGFLPCVSR